MQLSDAAFERVEQFKNDESIIIPTRKTAESAGYDFYCAEDTVIPPSDIIWDNLLEDGQRPFPLTLDEMAALTKAKKAKITLVPTGIKCKLPHGYYLKIVPRSSLPLKHWLIMGNSEGIIDADYYGNPDNDGHIYFQLINLSPFPIVIKKGDCFGQGIILEYNTVAADSADGVRIGGFGSTSKN